MSVAERASRFISSLCLASFKLRIWRSQSCARTTLKIRRRAASATAGATRVALAAFSSLLPSIFPTHPPRSISTLCCSPSLHLNQLHSHRPLLSECTTTNTHYLQSTKGSEPHLVNMVGRETGMLGEDGIHVDMNHLKSGEVNLGTSIMAVNFKDGVILGADSRTTTGAYIANRVTDKLTKVHDTIWCCRSGSAADTQAVADIVQYHLGMYGIMNNEAPTTQTAAALFQELCYDNKDQLR